MRALRRGEPIPHSRPTLGPREAEAAARVVRSGQVAQGKEVEAFEGEIARYLGLRGGVAVNAGTTALTLVLRAMGAGPEKEVILPAYACPSIVHAVRASGASPILADIHWHDLNVSAAQIRRRLTHRTLAVVAVHGFGAPVELEALARLGVPVVEDAAQALGAQDYNGRKLGSFGSAAVLSFYATKLITSGGEGGMVVSEDRRLLDAVRDLREPDEKPPTTLRLNAKMTDVQAAVGRVQLRRLPAFLAARHRLAREYRDALAGLPLDLPLQVFGRVYHRFVVKSRRPVTEALLRSFAENGVSVRRPVFRPLSRDLPQGAFPVSERAWRRALSVPLYPTLAPGEFQKVVDVLRRAAY